MCYDLEEGHRNLIKQAIHVGVPVDQLNEMIHWFNERYKPVHPLKPIDEKRYHISGFEHSVFDVIYSHNGNVAMEEMRWGLIPFWCKEQEKAFKLWNSTINARTETMFEKPSFRKAAKQGRGIIMVGSFFEHHHANKQTYPFNIRRKNGNAVILGVIWDEWTDRTTGEILKTFSIATVKGNEMLTKIHNNPKLAEPRMPLILEGNQIQQWLDLSLDKDSILNEVCKAFPTDGLEAHTVGKLRGKNAVGSGPEAIEKVEYEELEIVL